LTLDQQERLALIQKALPTIHRNKWYPYTFLDEYPICIDCEWHRETGCPCGVVGRPVGTLELIGVGNERWVSQFWWQELDEEARAQLRLDVMDLIRAVPVVFQNADADIRKLRANGFPITGPECFRQLDDLMLAHAVLESELPHDLEFLTAEHGHLPQHKDLAKVAPVEYNAADLVEPVLIWKNYILPFLARDPQAEYIYRHKSMPFLWLAIEGEEAGIRVDASKPIPLYEKFDAKREQAARLIQAYCGWPVNLNSPDQIKHVLYNLEDFPIQRQKAGWGEEGKPTSDKDAISFLRRSVGVEWDAEEAPTLELAWAAIEDGGNPALEARYLHMGAQQALSHYVAPCLTDDLDKPRERIFPDCRIHVQASGRVGYVGPALPQMKGELLDQLIPDPGHVWIGWDWRQIEPRILAYEADDHVAIAVAESGTDFYEPDIRAFFPEVGAKELEALRRRWGKAFKLRLHYRGRPENSGDIPGTRALWGTDTAPLVAAAEVYLKKHPALPRFWAEVDAEADRTGMVRTFMGRPRRLTQQNQNARRREASNHKMQGGVADIWLTVALLIKQAAPWSRLVFGAYDSQFWQVPAERQTEFVAIAAPIVGRSFTINGHAVSFPADWKIREAA
jgi:DNA polymerase I-like protein with 3'-5' exonuclease and polymerase domains